MLVKLWCTLITPAAVGMPVITIIYIVQTCSYLPNTKITWPSPNTRQFYWTICETLIPPAILVIRWKRSCCTNSSLSIHTHILLSPPHLHSVVIPMTHVYILPLLTRLQNVYLHSPITRTSPVQKDHFHDIGMPVTHSYVMPMLACLWKLNLL